MAKGLFGRVRVGNTYPITEAQVALTRAGVARRLEALHEDSSRRRAPFLPAILIL